MHCCEDSHIEVQINGEWYWYSRNETERRHEKHELFAKTRDGSKEPQPVEDIRFVFYI